MCYLRWSEIINVRLSQAQRSCELRKEHRNRIALIDKWSKYSAYGEWMILWPVSNTRKSIANKETLKLLVTSRHWPAGRSPKVIFVIVSLVHIYIWDDVLPQPLLWCIHLLIGWRTLHRHTTQTDLCPEFLPNFTPTCSFIKTGIRVVRIWIWISSIRKSSCADYGIHPPSCKRRKTYKINYLYHNMQHNNV